MILFQESCWKTKGKKRQKDHSECSKYVLLYPLAFSIDGLNTLMGIYQFHFSAFNFDFLA